MHGLYDIFEKTYFKSLEDREKIIGRVQLNFTIYVSMLAVIFYMLRIVDYNEKIISLIMFFVALLSCLSSMLTSLYFAYKTLCGNYDYRYFKPHHKVSGYINNLQKYRNKSEQYNTKNNEISMHSIGF
ncbi:hypothetical protein [Sodalis sp. dw_96]|uniref:hypothetical protein n=1 Tax=Sodalis sp. dw_96 TaxID=2719794 RepID=UPI001BD3E7D4|nr:hypothetical protein [Sodalis sp. dw_96]